uniref:recombinase family protein n=1 Tax=uncultured Allobacillus sp. TaxID=1638025 RepID=UPI002593464A|nr:recombinase family protein [uncultured Allobacillus sp.]
MKIGYARVSSVDQNLDRQIKQLEEFECEHIVEEKMSGATRTERKELEKLMNKLRFKDVLVVSDLSRIARSLNDLLSILEELKEKEVDFISIKENIDTRNDNIYSNFMIQILGAIAEFERNLTKERQREGIAIAKSKGKYKGGKEKYTEDHKGIQEAVKLYKKGTSIVDIAEITNISRPTLYKKFKALGLK